MSMSHIEKQGEQHTTHHYPHFYPLHSWRSAVGMPMRMTAVVASSHRPSSYSSPISHASSCTKFVIIILVRIMVTALDLWEHMRCGNVEESSP